MYSSLSSSCDRLKFNKLTLTVIRKNGNILILEKDKNKPILLISCPKDTADPLSINYLSKAICDAQAVKNEYGFTPFIATISPSVSAIFTPIENMCKKSLSLDDYSTIISHYRFTIIPTRQSDFETLLEEITKEETEKKKKDIQNYLVVYLRDYVLKTIINYLQDHKSLFTQPEVLSRLNDEAKKLGYENGISTDKEAKGSLYLDNLLRMMAYVLIDKIIFYKILENYYNLKRLLPLYKSGVVKNNLEYLAKLNELFEEAKYKSGNFDVIFDTGIYDLIHLGNDSEIAQVLDSLIELLESQDLDQFTKIVGYIYEDLIPPEERHKLGQFYTPPPIVELITKWAVRSADYKVLDAGSGSGTFISEAYNRLFYLKTGKEIDIANGIIPTDSEHSSILGKLYAVDINPFAAHLTAMRLSLKSPKYPAKDMNIVIGDFFKIKPAQSVLLPHKTVGGKEEYRSVVFSNFDAIIGNPPYTRWNDLSNEERRTIRDEIGKELNEYNLTPKKGEGLPLYVHWIVHAERFLKDHGKLGMIISNMWLQTDYGKDFGKYLLDHFKIKALIDVPQKIFDAIITTVILLAEKESNEANRMNNRVLIARITDENKVTEALECLESSLDLHYEFDESKLKECEGLWFKFVNQSDIQTNQKWITLFFNITAYEELERLVKESQMIRLGDWFEPSRGNAVYLCLASWGLVSGTKDYGAKEFFEFNESKKINGIQSQKGTIKVPEECLYPAILDAELIRTFTFTEKDWENLRDKGKDVYLFVCHKPKNEEIKDYLEWGENECKNRSGRPCNEAESAKAREKEKSLFYGWYDLGGVLLAPLMAKRYAQYYPQFFISEYPAVTNDGIITLIPKVNVKDCDVNQLKSILGKLQNKEKKRIKKLLDDIEKNSKTTLSTKELKALTAYLNSTLVWNWLEFRSRRTSGGLLAIEVDIAKDIPIPNLKGLSEKDVDNLAKLFDELEAEARKHLDIKNVLETLNFLKPIKQKIDRKICEIYGLKIDVEALWNSTVEMMQRRIAGNTREKLDLGSEKKIKIRKGRKGKTVSLESFMYED
jgi:type I restriction-modification system DNA methylase subunit